MKTVQKRPTPCQDALDRREHFLQQLGELAVERYQPRNEPPLEQGNSKIGTSGGPYKAVFVWNLPAIASCPGASNWCKKHCYNGDDLPEKFHLDRWRNNLAWANEHPKTLSAAILDQLQHAPQPTAVRVHSSGDFYSNEYIDLWATIAASASSTAFWAYTRSWQSKELQIALDRLRGQKNFELFASWDQSMPTPPSGWRASYVYMGHDRASMGVGHNLPGNRLVCPEQLGRTANCASCGYCIEKRQGHVLFSLH
jgi:hypothetical protein